MNYAMSGIASKVIRFPQHMRMKSGGDFDAKLYPKLAGALGRGKNDAPGLIGLMPAPAGQPALPTLA